MIHVQSTTQNTINVKDSTISYPFVDCIRMIAMIGIIWAHTPNFEGSKSYNSLDNIPLYFFFMDFLKFGVISFFLISGFLLARKIEIVPAVAYFQKRIFSTLYPYLFAFFLIVVLFIIKTNILGLSSSKTISEYIISMFLDSALWFLPNYWISLLTIICLKKILSKIYCGLLLLIITLCYSYFYVYTVYAQPHVNALFAFVFYLWLGYFIGKNNLQNYFQRINIYLLLICCLILYIFTSLESLILYQNGSQEPMNILRVSNQLYSLAVFVTMVKIFIKPVTLKFLNPRNETFGIYLYHMFSLAILAFGLKVLSKTGINTYSDHTLTFIIWFIAKFIFVYFCTLLMVKIMLKYNLGFLNYNKN